jgi:putative membrane protein insertion efficiency factor
MHEARGPGRRRLLAAVLIGGLAYLSAESLLPPSRQPTAWAARTAIRGYQVAGSPAMASMGVRCRYTPTCSHYAAAAIGHYGTVEGLVRTAGRIWRCSPWGGMGYDPAVASRTPVLVRQETQDEGTRLEEERRKGLEDQQRALEKAKRIPRQVYGEGGKLSEEDKKKIAAATGACVGGCVLLIAGAVGWLAITIFMMLYVLKDGKARGDSNVALWAVLVWLFPILGFIVYFFARPKGDLAPCPHCKAGRLAILAKCPHCGAETAGGAKSA